MNYEKTYILQTPQTTSENITLGELFDRSEKTLLFFYSKDNTPGCSVENVDFTNLKAEFHNLGIQLIGVSKDSTESHEKFICNYSLENALLSDPDLTLHNDLGAYGEKNNYGKIIQGVIRSTFLFDRAGNILQEWRNVRAKGHAAKVLREIIK